MSETWTLVEIPERLRALERPFLDRVTALLEEASGGDEEAYWYLAWRLELDAIDRNMIDQSKVRKQSFDEQHGLCGDCHEPLGKPAGHDVHKRLRMFARHQGYVPGNVVLLHRSCHERVHQREPHHPSQHGT